MTPSTSSGSAPRATDQVRRDEWNAHERSHTPTGRWVKGTRWSLLKAPEHQTIGQLATLAEVQQANRRLYRAFLLREELRLLYHLPDPRARARAPRRLAGLGRRARGCRPFVRLARTLRAHRDGILAAIRLGLSNGRLEGLNSQDPPDQPPRLRLPLRRPPDRPRLPLLHRHHDRAPAMNFTPNSDEAPHFWRLAGNEPVVFVSPEEFLTFAEPGFAKAVVGFRLDPRGAGILLTTETRFVATDEATHRLMSRYWRIIRPGSNLSLGRSGCERSEGARFAARKRPRSPHNTSERTRTVPTSAAPTLRVLRQWALTS